MSWGVATQNGVSVSLASIVSLSAGVTEFSPADLFTGGVAGAWYDPSDYSTLFQDSAGTTPVTAVEQPVGLMLDKSQGLVLGPELITDAADRTFTSDTGWWTKGGSATIGSGKCTLTTGSSIQRLNLTTSGRWYVIEYDLTVRSGALYLTGYFSLTNSSTSGRKKFYIYATTGTFRPVVDSGDADITNITIKELPGNHASQATSTSRPVLRARYNTLLATETLATQSVTTLAASYKLAFSGAGSITLSGTATGTYSAGTNTITCTAGTLTLTVSGTVTQADLRLASTATSMPAYQRVTTATDYATAGFLPYLYFDGSDDYLTIANTNDLNFGQGSFWAQTGLTSLGASQYDVVWGKNSASNDNIRLFLNSADALAVFWGSDAQSYTGSTFQITKNTAQIQEWGVNSSGPTAFYALNGTENTPAITLSGTGSNSSPAYIGISNNLAIYQAQMNLYGMILRKGTLPTATQRTASRNWMAAKTGVTL